MDNPGMMLMLIVVCLLLEGLFSGGEMALVAANLNKIRYHAGQGSRSAALVLKFLEKPEWFFATTLTGTDLCIIIESSLATTLCISLFGGGKGQVVSALVMVPIIIVFGEIIPKSLFQQRAESVAMRIVWFIRAVAWVLYPVVFIISGISRITLSVLADRPYGSGPSYITKEGLKFLLKDRTGAKTDVRASEKEMVGRILDFSSETVGHVMVPLSNVRALEKEVLLSDAFSLMKGKWFSRIPVYDREIFNIVGVLYGFDLLKVLPTALNEPIGKYARAPVHFVPEMKRASDLLIEMQRQGVQLAVVVDEYGGATGIVTIEDLLEEIVGEIDDEYDQERRCRKIGPGRYVVDAKMRIETVREMLQVEIPDGNYETLGGFLLERMGKIPRKGERFNGNDALYVVQSADSKSIRDVLVMVSAKVTAQLADKGKSGADER